MEFSFFMDYLIKILIRGPRSSPCRIKNFYFSISYRSVLGAYPDSYPMGIVKFSPGVNWPVREANHSLPTSAEVMKTSVYIPTPPYVFMA
jgi:hypothetical protein